ncbi:hypothetical protein PUR61_18125 [Streptomyces sp. BE20]|nr:hypothetical protein [Streptomyces sp. BE20]MEE1824090.1 hypothetical protein [Streptomyces sp. BE20]
MRARRLRPDDRVPMAPGRRHRRSAHRSDLVADRTRTVNRLRSLLNGIFPALNRALDLTDAGPSTLLSRVAEGNLTPRLSQIGA